MGTSNSKELEKEFKVVKDFKKFISNLDSRMSDDFMTEITPLVDNLQEHSENFFETYKRLTDARKIGGDGFDLNRYFKKIGQSLESFKEYVKFIQDEAKSSEADLISATFCEDLKRFVTQITNFLVSMNKILERLQTEVKPSLMTQFYLELSIFNYSLNVSKSDTPPYYEMTTLSAYEFRNQIHDVKKKIVNIIGPHGTGKTSLIPMHFACKFLSVKNPPRFIVVVEHDQSLIHKAINVYRKIIKTTTSFQMTIKEEEEEEEEEFSDDYCDILVTHSISNIVKIENKPQILPSIVVLSPMETLKLLRSVKNMDNFIAKSLFIIDDVHLRTVETDVLVHDIHRSKSKQESNGVKIAFISIVSDQQFLNYFGRVENIIIDSNKKEPNKKEIFCESISDIESKCLFREMKHFFNTWLTESSIAVGSTIVFIPSEKLGQKILNAIFKHYNNDNSLTVCPLRTTLRRGEKIDDFYNRLLGDMTIAENERKEIGETLFLLPINLSGIVSSEERSLVQSNLPLPFRGKLTRIFITTIKNESILQVNDLSVIFDTGIEEVEIFNAKQSSFHIVEELLPKPFIEQHQRLLDNGIYYQFIVRGKDRPLTQLQSVKRSDLGRSLLSLRSIGIKLEKILNLPLEPNHEILDECFKLLKKIGLIEDSEDKELTNIGKIAAKYSVVSPFYALAIAKFDYNKKFAFLCSLIIENARSLIVDPKAPLLMKNFCNESDIVTLLESIREISEKDETEKSGLDIGTVYAIYSMIETTFNCEDGKKEVIEIVNWGHSQKINFLTIVNKFVKQLDENELLNKRRASFLHVLGAGIGNEPVLIYKANDVFNFENEDDETKVDKISKIKIARRPGWIGLQSPGNIIALSVIVDEERKINRGLLIHYDKSKNKEEKLPGVVSMQVDNPSLNSFFFVSLFNAYWSDHSIVDDFIGIYHTIVPKKENAFLIHMTEDDGKTFINYCPKSSRIDKRMNETIQTLTSLMPFVPRSIIAKVDSPICAVEINGHGTSIHYTTSIHLIAEDGQETPIPYPVNKTTLQYCVKYIDLLKETMPKIRFAITGESFYYKSLHGREVIADLAYPDVAPDAKCVFDPSHASHLVILIDRSIESRPKMDKLEWLPMQKKYYKTHSPIRNERRHNLDRRDTNKIVPVLARQNMVERRRIPIRRGINDGRNTPIRRDINERRNIPIRRNINEKRKIPIRRNTNEKRKIPNKRAINRRNTRYSDDDYSDSPEYNDYNSDYPKFNDYNSDHPEYDDDEITDKEENELMLNVASKIMNGIGYIEHSSDIFYVTINKSYPKVEEGEIPATIRNEIEYSEKDKSIKRGIYPLVRHFVKEITKNQKLTEPIPLKKISSTQCNWENKPKNEHERNLLISEISKKLTKHFHLKEEVQVTFIGHSMLAIRTVNLDQDLTVHKINQDVWDDNYQQCRADKEIEQQLKTIIGCKVNVVHEPSIGITIWKFPRFVLTNEEFEEKVKKIVNDFGFLVAATSEYFDGPTSLEEESIGVQGCIQIELIGIATSIAFATLIANDFPTKIMSDMNDTMSITMTMATFLGMTTINPRLGPAPKVTLNQRVVKIDPSEIEDLKNLIAMKNAGQKRKKWKIDTNFNVLIVPASEDAAIKEMMRKVRDKDNDTTCIFVCEPPQVLLPNSLYAYQKDGTVKTIAVCKQCMIETFRGNDDFMSVIDPVTKLVDRAKLANLNNNLMGLPFINDEKDEDDIVWPQIPLGQGAWVLLCDTEDIAPYVKSYFTAIIDFVIRKARNYFTSCPNHPDILYRTPPKNAMMKCPYCSMIFCSNCRIWHKDGIKCGPDDGTKRCPNCNTPTYKTSGCNHITCPCGKHWCYKCEKSPIFHCADDCYKHMRSVHGDIYD